MSGRDSATVDDAISTDAALEESLHAWLMLESGEGLAGWGSDTQGAELAVGRGKIETQHLKNRCSYGSGRRRNKEVGERGKVLRLLSVTDLL